VDTVDTVDTVDAATPDTTPVAAHAVAPVHSTAAGHRPALEVISPGVLTLLEDMGRPGFAGMGVSTSGALDTLSLREANRLVGNAVSTACLEIAHGGLRVRSRGNTVVGATGAPTPLTVTRPDGRTRTPAFGRPFALEPGDELTLGAPTAGARTYLAVRGGFAVPSVLGSTSTDILAGLGPAPLAAGTILPVLPIARGVHPVALTESSALTLPTPAGPGAGRTGAGPSDVVLDIVLGPRTDWFSPEAVASLTSQSWTVSPRSNRVGLRLDGEPLTRLVGDELPSEGTVSGALQIPHDGLPVLFLADHPLTGGYPVIGAVAVHHLSLAGQLPAGAAIRFHPLGGFAEYTEDRP
jgi:biotin-dependent carboxylase-like uncharacterized protein